MITRRLAMVAGLCLVIFGGILEAKDVGLPRLVDLGAGKCIPCKRMKPILEQLREEYKGRMEVVFIDVWEKPDEAKGYGISAIPTQIFYDASGKERARHEGFFSKEEILNQWKELGVTFDSPKAKAEASETMESAYPGLVCEALTYARLGELPKGVLLKAGAEQITEADLEKKIASAPAEVQKQLKKNLLFCLEMEAKEKLLLTISKLELGRAKTDCKGLGDREIIETFVRTILLGKINVSDVELAAYYEKNKEKIGGASFEQAKSELKDYAIREKMQKTVEEYIRTLGKRMPITVSSAWVKEQAKMAKDNPIDRARANGRVTLVDFGAEWCQPCKMMTPILKELAKKYDGKVNVLFVNAEEESILATRYTIQTIPVQIIFDKDGKQVFRHTGFLPQEEIEAKFKEMGVK